MHGFYAVSDSHRYDGMVKKLPIHYVCSVDYNVPHSEFKFSQNSQCMIMEVVLTLISLIIDSGGKLSWGKMLPV